MLEDEFSRFCRAGRPFVATEFFDGVRLVFLLKLSIIDSISEDIFCGALLTIIVSGNSDICNKEETKFISEIRLFANKNND